MDMDKESVVITHFVDPQLFCYATLQQLRIGGASVHHVESQLAAHCQPLNQREFFTPDTYVIVRFQPRHRGKLLRGVVVVGQHDEYLVWAMDYGFALNCARKDLWLLPGALSQPCIQFEWGGVAHIAPRADNEWSKMAIQLLDKRIEQAKQLVFKVGSSESEGLNLGQLLIGESLQDAASFLLEKQCARQVLSSLSISRSQGFDRAFNWNLAELNDADIKPRERVHNILDLLEQLRSKVDSPLATANGNEKEDKKTEKFANSIFNNGYHRLGTKVRGLKSPSQQTDLLDKLLQAWTQPQIPESARRLSKVSSGNIDVVETALIRKSTKSSTNSTSSNCSSDSFDIQEPPAAPSRSKKGNILQFYRSVKVQTPPSRDLIRVQQRARADNEIVGVDKQESNGIIAARSAKGKDLESSSQQSGKSQKEKAREPAGKETSKNMAKDCFDEVNRLQDSSKISHRSGDKARKDEVNRPQDSSKITQGSVHISDINRKESNVNSNNKVPESSKEAQIHSDKNDSSSNETLNNGQCSEQYMDKLERIYNAYRFPMPSKGTQATKKNPRPVEEEKKSPSTQSSPFDMDKLERIYNSYRFPDKAASVDASPGLPPMETQVLAHSKPPAQPMRKVSDSLLCPDVLSAMKQMNIEPARATQRYAWPYLMGGKPLVLVDRSGSGRSWCYLPALCSLVMSSMRTPSMDGKPNLGPLGILLADSVASAQALFQQCSQLMSAYGTKKVKVVNSHEHTENELQLRLLNSCGILVTTPTHLKNLLQSELKLIDPGRLKFFIMDDYDRILARQPELLQELPQLLQSKGIAQLQLVIVAQQWHPLAFFELTKRFSADPLFLFGDFLEAALYGSHKLVLTVVSSDKKSQQLLDYLKTQHTKGKRSLIYCKDQQELNDLRRVLALAGFQCIGYKEAAQQLPHQLLLLEDSSQACQLPAGNFDLVVHFSLPASWSRFTYRFHAVKNQIGNYLHRQKSAKNSISYVLLDEHNKQELPRLVQCLKAHGIDLGKQMDQVVATYRQFTDQNGSQVCSQLLRRGECLLSYCTQRHFPIPSDFQLQTGDLWQSGTVLRGKIIKVYNPVHFAFLPVSFKADHSATWQNASNLSKLRQLSMALSMHMSLDENRRPKSKMTSSDICILHRRSSYQRVRIVDSSDKRWVTVQMMDEGREVLKVQPGELLECDARFTVDPALALDVQLCGLVPPLDEGDWQPEAKKWVTHFLSDLSEDQQLQLTVDMAMFEVVYVKDIELLQDCPSLRTCVKATQLREGLVTRGFARINEIIINNLHVVYTKFMENQKLMEDKFNSKTEEQEPKQEEVSAGHESSEKKFDQKANQANPPSSSRFKFMEIVQAVQKFFLNQEAQASSEEIQPATENDEGHQQRPDDGEEEQKPNLQSDVEKAPAIDSTASLEKTPPIESTATLEKAPPIDSTAFFMEALLKELNEESTINDAAKNMMQEIFEESDHPTDEPEKTMDSVKKQSTPDVQTVAKPKLVPDKLVSALSCGVVAGRAVRPKVRWHQTLMHIELVFEQQVPEYELLHQGNVLIYQVTETTPPQRCILNLLGEVKILSKRQHGYRLHVKLAKIGLNVYWPSLLDSLQAQQHCHWLVYDMERSRKPPSDIGRLHWMSYERKDNVQRPNDSEDSCWSMEDDDDNSMDFSDGD